MTTDPKKLAAAIARKNAAIAATKDILNSRNLLEQTLHQITSSPTPQNATLIADELVDSMSDRECRQILRSLLADILSHNPETH